MFNWKLVNYLSSNFDADDSLQGGVYVRCFYSNVKRSKKLELFYYESTREIVR